MRTTRFLLPLLVLAAACGGLADPNAKNHEPVATLSGKLTTSTPDLSMIAAARPDVQIATHSPQVTLDISNLLPWVYPSGAYTGDLLMVAGSQANAFGRPHSVRPAAAATTWHGTFDWNLMATSTTPAGLPDVSKGDVEFIYQRATRPLGGGVAHWAARYQRLDNLTLTDGTPASLSAMLADAPQTGSLHVDLRGTQWAALARLSQPAVRLGGHFGPLGAGTRRLGRELRRRLVRAVPRAGMEGAAIPGVLLRIA